MDVRVGYDLKLLLCFLLPQSPAISPPYCIVVLITVLSQMLPKVNPVLLHRFCQDLEMSLFHPEPFPFTS